MKEIKLGSIGSGPIVHWIMDMVMETEGISLYAVYSRTKEKGEELAKEYNAKKVYTDMDEFLADKEIDFVYIASPNLLHYEQCKKAIMAGKNVLCEKPMVTKESQARELASLAKEKGVLLVDATPTAFLPNFDVIKELLPEIGRVRLVQGNYSQYSSRYDLLLKGEVTNIFNPEFGGGCLMDINYYNLYLTIGLFGKPKSYSYKANRFKDLADTSGILTVEYDDFVGTLVGAKDTWGINYYQIEGEKGFIYVEDGSNGLAKIIIETKEGRREINRQENPNRYHYAVGNFTSRILNKDYTLINERLEYALTAMGIIEGARKEIGLEYPGDRH